MWFGTQYGLNRYDGYRFKVFKHDPSDPNSLCGVDITSLFKDRSGTLWIGCDYSLDRYDPTTESFVHYSVGSDSSAPSAAIRHISEDTDGMLWLSTGNGLYRLDPRSGTTQRFAHRSDDPLSLRSDDIKSSGQDRAGQMWVAHAEGLDALDRKTGRVNIHLPMRESRDFSFYEDRSGTFWVLTASDNGLAILDRERLRLQRYSFAARELPGSPLTGVSRMIEDQEGTLWIGTFSDGILKLDRDRNRFIRYRNDPFDAESLSENRITTLFEDREGNIWAGLGASVPGFFAPQAPSFTKLPFDASHRANLGETLVNALYEDSTGTLWIGTTGALRRLDRSTGNSTHYEIPGDGVASDVLSVAEDRQKNLWIGTSGQGLYRFDWRHGTLTAFRHNPELATSISDNTVVRLLIDREGVLWAATLNGLNRFDPVSERFQRYKHASGAAATPYLSMAEDAAGALWIGGYGSGLLRFDTRTGQFEVFKRSARSTPGLTDNRVNSVLIDRAGMIWAGTQNGLNKLDPRTGQWSNFLEKDGLASNVVSCIQEDAAGHLWMGTTQGVSRLDPERKSFKHYSVADGLPGADMTGWGACFGSSSGELFFGGFAGAIAFRPEQVAESSYVPPIVLTGFQLFGAPVTPGSSSPLKHAIGHIDQIVLSHLQNSFSFEFSTLSFRSPETNRYRYRLEGLDSQWREVGSHQRLANYTTLPAGTYRFIVQGATSRGPWSDPGSAVAIVITPPWWATTSFRLQVGAMVLLAMWAAYARRVRRIKRQFSIRLEERVAERTRIARELHDSLLQGFQGLMFRLQAMRELLPHRSDEALHALSTALDRADGVIVEARAAVQDLRTSPFAGADLESAVKSLVEELSAAGGVGRASYRVIVEGRSRAVVPTVRDDIYRIVREAVRNAARHSRAQRIEVEIAYHKKTLAMRIRDDGVGIDREVLQRGKREGHWGLLGMRERANAFGGNVTVWSENSVGTEVELTIPAGIAYATPLSQLSGPSKSRLQEVSHP